MNPIQPAPHLAEQKRKFWGKMIWISAGSLVLSICLGIGNYIHSMISAYQNLKVSGAADPNALADDISSALIGTLLAIAFAFAALFIFIIAIVRHRKFSNPTQAG